MAHGESHEKEWKIMDTNIIDTINRKALNAVAHLKPDFSKYPSEDFDEYYFNRENFTFVQVKIRDRTNPDSYHGNSGTMSVTPEQAKKLKEEIDEYQEALEEAQQEACSHLDDWERENYLMFSEVGQDIGYCVWYYRRNRVEEKAHDMNDEKEYAKRMLEDGEFRRTEEWLNAEYRPHGGAFENEADFARHVGIKLKY